MKSEEEIRKQIINKVSSKIKSSKDQVTEATALIGEGSEMDSMKLVELCLDLEDMATKLNFEFDWTSDKAMSKSFSIFRTAKSLTEEFIKQKNKSK